MRSRCTRTCGPHSLQHIQGAPGGSGVSAVEQADQGARIIGICAGALVLGRTVLLDGRGFASHWCYRSTLLERHPGATYAFRRAAIYGERPERSFRQAATKYVNENLNKRSMENEALHLRLLDPFIGDLPLRRVHMGTVQPFIAARRAQGVKTKTINLALAVVRHILNLAASEWLDENGLTWLELLINVPDPTAFDET